MPLEGADTWGAGAGDGAGAACSAGLAGGAGADWAAAGGSELLPPLPLLPPQLATPAAMRRIAAAVARTVIGLLRFMGVPSVGVWNKESFPVARAFVVGRRETPLPATGAVVRAASASEDSELALPGGNI